MSFAQQRLWFLEQLGGTGPSYTLAHALNLSGSLDMAALDKAVQHVVERHESLRTTFEMIDDDPVQVIRPSLIVDVPVVDLCEWPEQEQSAQVQRLIDEEARRLFDLTTGPLLRVLLLKLNPQQHVLTLCVHHIVTDGWSMGIFFRELSAAYNAYRRGRRLELGDLTIQYTDYASWQRERLHGDVLNSQEAYWRARLEGAPQVLELPADRSRPAVQSYRGAHVARQLTPELLVRLKELGRLRGCTLFMTLLAAFQVLLYRYTGQQDIVIGSPVAGRNCREFERIIGFFLNTLLFRVDLSGDPIFEEVLQQVRETALDAYAHQDLPFEHLVKVLKPERDLSRAPLFQVLFALQTVPRRALNLDGCAVTRMTADTGGARFDLSLKITERDESLTAVFEYNSDLFDRTTIERMAEHFEILLEGVVANPQQRVSKLPLASTAERHRLLVDWNDTATDYSKDACIHQLFEEQVKRTPDAQAVVFQGKTLSYRELDQRAGMVAHRLQELGVGPEVVVGLCVERSLEMVVGLLGVLKAGGAYVPLDPSYPKERLEFMLQDTAVPVLLTQARLRAVMPEHAGQTLWLDELDWEKAATRIELRREVKAENLAYVMYTSGSTGEPKGIEMPHRGLVNLIEWNLRQRGFVSPARTLQFTTLGFDVSVQEIFTTWCSGGTLMLVAERMRRNFSRLARSLSPRKIERLFLPNVALEHLAATLGAADLGAPRLTEIISAGEQLRVTPSVRRLFEALPGCTLHNHYGPSETHVVTAFELTGVPVDWPLFPPIGRPIANTRAYVLDHCMAPVPIGVPGELYIGGVCLARGYRNRPDLTRERFVPDPFTEKHDARLYRTGDRVRYRSDGNIEFLGRLDEQVKVRGVRIEPGEIESALVTHPHVEESIVLARGLPGVERQLTAYVVPDQTYVPSANELRSFLREKLPDYMVPTAFVPLEALPLTPSGKVDRLALAQFDQNRQPEETFVPPRTQIERKLAEIWKKILWLDHTVGVHDNFFDLGGHSLLSVRLVAEIEDAFDKKLPVSALFQLSTIADLASILGEGQGETTEIQPSHLAPEIYHQLLALTAGWQGQRISSGALMVGLNTEASKQPLFWCFQGYRELKQLAKYLGNDQPTYGMRSGHHVMKYTPENIEALASHYVEEILTVEPVGPYLLGGNCQAAIIAFEVAKQLQSRGKTVTLLCTLERFIPQFYQGRRALFFGFDSKFQPYKSFQTPELGWHKYCPEGFTLDLVTGVHGQFFNEPNIQILAEKLENRIGQAQLERANSSSLEAATRIPSNEAYRAVLSAQRNLAVSAGEEVRIPIKVDNVSAEIWPCTDKSGITVGNHWLRKNGKLVQWLDGRVTLDRDLLPGASTELILPVTAPKVPGRYLLELDLVEEGITWFKKKGSKTTLVTITVSGSTGPLGPST